MTIKRFHWILELFMPAGFAGITLWPFGIYFRDPSRMTPLQKRHEMIHWQQQKEMFGLFYYLWYLVEWITRLLLFQVHAYRNISFEREAYQNAENSKYLRKRFAWLHYIFNSGE